MSPVPRRTFLASSLLGTSLIPLLNTFKQPDVEGAAAVLQRAVDGQQVRGASLYVQSSTERFSRTFGAAHSANAAFLLGSISKPIALTALMTLYAAGRFDLDDAVQRYLPEFRGDGRKDVTIRHLLTHVSGLPDQLPQNAELRSQHATLDQFVAGALQVPLQFEPGTRYQYSSMGILLAAEIAQRLSGIEIHQLVSKTVLQPLGMTNSALGTGKLLPEQMMLCQVEFGAIESGAGTPESKNWDWNSSFWRNLGAPWGGLHASAEDVGKFLNEFLHPSGKLFRTDVIELMIQNHNPAPLKSRGLAFDVGMQAQCAACSPSTFGHTGSTGTIAWADPERDLICVVLTTLPAGAPSADRHPRQLASDLIAGG